MTSSYTTGEVKFSSAPRIAESYVSRITLGVQGCKSAYVNGMSSPVCGQTTASMMGYFIAHPGIKSPSSPHEPPQQSGLCSRYMILAVRFTILYDKQRGFFAEIFPDSRAAWRRHFFLLSLWGDVHMTSTLRGEGGLSQKKM